MCRFSACDHCFIASCHFVALVYYSIAQIHHNFLSTQLLIDTVKLFSRLAIKKSYSVNTIAHET